MSDLIAVRGEGQPNRVVLFEKNLAHPDGEIFIVSGETATVSKTPMVAAALRRGTLRVVSSAPEPESDGEAGDTDDAEGADGAEAQEAVAVKRGRPARQ